MELDSPAIVDPAERIQSLEAELEDVREGAAIAISSLKHYRAAVRATVIENVMNGTICLAGANDALEEWGDEPFEPRFQVRMTVEFDITVGADTKEQARDVAYGSFYVVGEDEQPVEIRQTSVETVEQVAT